VITFAALLLVAQPQVGQLAARVESQPRQVRIFIERRAECVHWMGEEPYDAARRRAIDRALRRLRCGTLDRTEASLRRRYAGNPDVLAILEETRDLLGW